MSKPIHHPLEDLLNINPGSTYDGDSFDIDKEYAMVEQSPTAVATQSDMPQGVPDIKDEDDIETDKKIDAIYEAAMETFQNQTAYTEIIEPRYAARNAEVAANYLSIALQAASTKAKTKSDRKKANATFIPFANNKTTNNIIVADRNEVLRMITIDNQAKEIP